MKKFYILLAALCAAVCLQAQEITQAEKLYQDGDFASAQREYEQIVKTATGAPLYQAQLRLAACQYSQGEYLTAAKTMLGYPLPENTLWKARFLLYRIQMARQVTNQYRRTLQTREIENNTDLEQWTRPQWYSRMQQDYEALWALRSELIKAPIEQETFLLNLKDTDTRRIPTLFDFTANSWADFLRSTEQTLPDTPARTYLDGAARPFSPHKNRAEKLAAILQTAYLLEGTERQNTRIFWQTDYILLPFERPDFFEIIAQDKALKNAVDQLSILSGYTKTAGLWNKLKGYLANPAADYGKSYAAYKAAQLLFTHDDRTQALALCNYAVKSLASSYYTAQCQELAEQITRQELSFKELPPALQPAKPQLELTVRNIPTVYARIYPVTKAELENFYRTHHNGRTLNSWNDLTQLNSKDIEALLTSAKTYQTAQTAVTYPKPYFENNATLTLPALSKGFYVVLASARADFNTKQAPVTGLVINITDLALFVTAAIDDNPDNYVWTLQSKPHTYHPDVFHFYTVNLQTGQPEPNVSLDLITAWKGTREKLATSTDATAHLKRAIAVNNQANNSYQVQAWAEKNGNFTFAPRPTYFHLYMGEPVRLFAQTDRAIYRPGQKVFLSVQAFTKTPRGLTVLPQKPVQIKVRNASGKQIYQAGLTLNAFGTAQTQFALPTEQDVMLGRFSVDVTSQIQGHTYHTYYSFQVEEYKRPEYEITLGDPAAPLAYGQKATVTGNAAYYTGMPVQAATVKYTVTRRNYVPPFYWWRNWEISASVQVAQGETKTNEKGQFEISFTPEIKQKNETAAQYTVHAEVYDQTGRAIDTSRSYQVNQYPRLFKVDMVQGFYDANTPAKLADITLTNAEGTPITGAVTMRAVRVKDTPDTNGKNLDTWYQNAPDAQTLFTKTLTFQTPGAQTVQLPATPEGIYRLTLKAKDAQDQSLIFVVAAKNSKLNLPAITLPQHSTYYPGETARILLGAGLLSGTKRVEVYQQGNFISSSEVLPGGVSVYESPVTQDNRGGLSIGWFGASGYQFYQGNATLTVPFDNQQLTVHVNVPDAVKPGQTVSWKLSAKNAAADPVNAQASVTVYDKSLDYYAKKKNPFSLENLFAQTASFPGVQSSRLQAYGITVFDEKTTHTWQQPPQLPTLNLVMQRAYYTRGATRGLMTAKSAAPMATATFGAMSLDSADMLASNATDYAVQESIALEEDLGTGDTQTVRTDFTETAYFNSQLPVTNGQATLRFTLPQSLTTWNILGYVLTKDVEIGSFTLSTITRKDFMVRLHLPRFYREGDKGVIQVSVANATRRKLTVPVTLAVKQGKLNKAAAFGLTTLTKNVTVEPNATAYASFDVKVPLAPGLYEITAVGRNGTDSDGEQRTLPVFAALSRLLASAHVALKNGPNTLQLTELDGVKDAHAEVAALSVHPSLALSVLNTMPNLLNSPYKDLVSSLNRYVPLAVVNTFYNTYPELKTAVQKLPKRTTLTAPWNETDPLRLTMLEQTPWLRLSQGQTAANVISLFDAQLVSKRLEQERQNVLKFQNANGSFSWFAGGPEDTYLTLRALDAFSQAVRFGAPVPQENVEKALAYMVPHIEKTLKEDKTGSASAVAYALYAAYTLSAFPGNWPQAAAAKPYIQKWADYADQQARFMTPLGQIYAAAVYHRLGDDVKANAYLDKVLARMKYNPLTGAYFAPEAQSWVWYQDTLTTQTATLKTLLEVRPESDKIDPMVQWLLFNRQVNSWQNPSAAAQAVFALLDVMKTKGALSSATTYQINWAGTQDKKSFAPFDWTEDLRWVKQDAQITPTAYTATVTKQGKMTDFASLNVVYTTAQAKASPKGVINVSRAYFVRFTQDGVQKLRPVKDMEEVKVDDEVEVQLTLTTDSAFEYVLLTDPKPAGFESAELTSGWTWNPVSMYREVRDADTHYFINRLPAGTVRVSYVLRPTVPGKFHAKPAQVQSLYNPEYGAHSAAEKMSVGK